MENFINMMPMILNKDLLKKIFAEFCMKKVIIFKY